MFQCVQNHVGRIKPNTRDYNMCKVQRLTQVQSIMPLDQTAGLTVMAMCHISEFKKENANSVSVLSTVPEADVLTYLQALQNRTLQNTQVFQKLYTEHHLSQWDVSLTLTERERERERSVSTASTIQDLMKVIMRKKQKSEAER